MYPILLQLGPITIYSLWIMIAIGFFAALLIINHLVPKSRLKLKFLSDNSLAIFLGGLIFSRIFFVMDNHDVYFSNLNLTGLTQIFYIWDKGLSIWGAIIGITLSLIYFCKQQKEDTFKWLDILSIGVIGAFAFGNIGAFLDGRNYGIETSLPWGVMIENSIYAVPIHPVQIYAAIYCGLLAIILVKIFDHEIGKNPGNISLIAVFGYAFFRFLEEFLRGDETNMFFGLREAQIYTLLAMVVSAILFYVKFRKNKQNLTNQ